MAEIDVEDTEFEDKILLKQKAIYYDLLESSPREIQLCLPFTITELKDLGTGKYLFYPHLKDFVKNWKI
jgi:hypothetical protein